LHDILFYLILPESKMTEVISLNDS
jgi:hypothetical protein